MDIFLKCPTELQDNILYYLSRHANVLQLLKIIAGIPTLEGRRTFMNRMYKIVTKKSNIYNTYHTAIHLHDTLFRIFYIIQKSQNGIMQQMDDIGLCINDIITPSKFFNPFTITLKCGMLIMPYIHGSIILNPHCNCQSQICDRHNTKYPLVCQGLQPYSLFKRFSYKQSPNFKRMPESLFPVPEGNAPYDDALLSIILEYKRNGCLTTPITDEAKEKIRIAFFDTLIDVCYI